LGAVGFIGDDGKGLSLGSGQFLHGLDGEGKV
jgi:hypothetical protein